MRTPIVLILLFFLTACTEPALRADVPQPIALADPNPAPTPSPAATGLQLIEHNDDFSQVDVVQVHTPDFFEPSFDNILLVPAGEEAEAVAYLKEQKVKVAIVGPEDVALGNYLLSQGIATVVRVAEVPRTVTGTEN